MVIRFDTQSSTFSLFSNLEGPNGSALALFFSSVRQAQSCYEYVPIIHFSYTRAQVQSYTCPHLILHIRDRVVWNLIVTER